MRRSLWPDTRLMFVLGFEHGVLGSSKVTMAVVYLYYRHPIRDFSFTELDIKEKWTAYRFT